MIPIPSLRHAGAALPLLVAGGAYAHPHHAHAPAPGFFEGLLQMLSQPDHLAKLALAAAVAVAGIRALRSRRAERPIRRL